MEQTVEEEELMAELQEMEKRMDYQRLELREGCVLTCSCTCVLQHFSIEIYRAGMEDL